jgi:sulfide dehydrogenase cytochrome subunit
MRNRFHSAISFCLLGFTLAASNAAWAQDASTALHQRANAAMCANCHGSEGRTVKDSAVPSIAGLPRDYMIQQMHAFKDGSRPATIMHQITKGLSEAQIASLADYFAAQAR